MFSHSHDLTFSNNRVVNFYGVHSRQRLLPGRGAVPTHYSPPITAQPRARIIIWPHIAGISTFVSERARYSRKFRRQARSRHDSAARGDREIRILTLVSDKRTVGTTAGQADLGMPARTNYVRDGRVSAESHFTQASVHLFRRERGHPTLCAAQIKAIGFVPVTRMPIEPARVRRDTALSRLPYTPNLYFPCLARCTRYDNLQHTRYVRV